MANSKKRGALTTFVATKWKTPNITPVITTTNCNNHANCCQHNTTFNKQYRANSCSTHISSMSCEGGRGFDSSCPEPRHRHNSGIISFITNSITTITTTAAAIATATATATISNSSTLGNIWNRGSPLPSSTVADFRVNSATSSATKVATGSRNAQSNGDTTTTTTSSSTFDSMTKPTTIVIASESETASPTSRGMTFPTFGPSTVSTTITAPSPSTSSSTTTKTPSSSSSSSCGRRQNFVATIPLKCLVAHSSLRMSIADGVYIDDDDDDDGGDGGRVPNVGRSLASFLLCLYSLAEN
uniref:Uncharacterized protein n=1 Tax=Stomoxys calcitrans TaxID=35570 RepID=A0A1I8NRK6_STOCA